MKGSFLDKVYQQYENEDLSRTCFVFPTRRAAYVYRKRFKGGAKTTWLPEILAVRDFIERLSPLPIADELVLLLILHDIVKDFEDNIPLDKFFPWGKILLNDFNEIDQNLVNAEALYNQSYEQREVDARFSLSEEELEDVAGFWKLFSKKPLSSLQQSFLENWKAIPLIYKKFKEVLFEKNIAYEGMAYRIIVEQLKEGKIILPWEQLVFGGFYALSGAEQAILEELKRMQKLSIYWDADSYYLENPGHEAGLYMRRNELLKTEFSWTHHCFKEIPKSIHITGAPMQTAQVKWISNLIKEKLKDPSFNPERSVIVLPDEAMLIPLLNSLPEELKGINITMGFPVKHTNTGNLLKSFIELHKNSKSSSGKSYFKRENVQTFVSLLQPAFYINADQSELNELYSQQYVSSELLKNYYAKIAFAFSELDGLTEVKSAFEKLLNQFTTQQKSINAIDKVVADYIREAFLELFSTLEQQSSTLGGKMILQLMEEGLSAVKVPFTGDHPENAIQIMGFLETRTLDFDNVFILSVNENYLPATSSGKTYIPYSIRKTYKLPLRNEQDAVYAYHFYRLLQRAKEVHLIYDTQEKSFSGGEMSRYLLQIAFELSENKGFPVKLFFNQVNTEALMYPEKNISIGKNDEIIDKLKSLYLKSDTAKGLSASSISDYVECSLRFYFKNIARLKKPEEPDEEISGKVFGNILHAAMSILYHDKKEFTKQDFKSKQSEISGILESQILKVYKKNVTTGNDLLLKGVLHDLMKRITDLDSEDAPLEILNLETVFKSALDIEGIGEVALSGIVDRIDTKEGIIRIIDYKTGKDEISTVNDISSFFTNPDKKVMMQLFLYMILLKEEYPGVPFKAGIFKLQSMSSGIQWINNGNVITQELTEQYTQSLTQLIKDIFDSSKAFEQTDNIKRCEYCDYNKLCNRL